MYHPTVINHKIDTWVRSGHPAPEYHSIAEVSRANDFLNSTREVDDSGQVHVKRAFTPEEVDWIRNERFLCRVDFHYFQSRYIWVKDPFDQVVQFSPWVSQKIFMDVLAEMELAEIAIMIQQLKARQLGISRQVSNCVLHRIVFFPHVNAIMGSSKPIKTIKLLDMLEFPLDRLPFWLVPEITARQRNGEGGFLEFGRMDTGITLQHGAQMSGIARGSTPTVGHLTELAEFDHPEELVDASLLRAMHDSPRTFLVLEGTGEGYNWWYRKWQSSKEGWPERRSRLRPCFLPWFTGSDLYPTPAFLRAHPIPDPYIPDPYVTEHARKAAEYVQSNDLLTKYLGSGWVMPKAQMWFYDVEYGQAKREARVNTFLQEMPASDTEAFQTKNLSAFEAETIAYYRSRERNPVGVYGLVGNIEEVPPRLQPHHTLIDTSKPRIPILANWGPKPIQYELVPLRWYGYSTDNGMDKVYIYEMPEPGEIYGLGVDTSYGVQRDRTTIECLRKGTAWRPAAQCAEFCSDKINALDAVPFTMALATLYSTEILDAHSNLAPEVLESLIGVPSIHRQCRVAIECKGNGDQTQLQMRFRGWTNFHPWQRIDNKKLDPSQFNKIGVYTTEWFRDGLMEFMFKMLRDAELDVRSPYFVQEMAALETSLERGRIEAGSGEHDDRFFSLGFIVISLYQWEKNRPVSITRPKPDKPNDGERRWARDPGNMQERMIWL